MPRETLPPSLAQALASYPAGGWDTRLAAVYGALPATECAREGQCCSLLPPVQPVEMLAWLSALAQEEPKERRQEAAGLVSHFLQNAARRLACPWAREGACARYPQRFFGCRAYGLWSPAAYESRRRAALLAAQGVQRAWAGLGLSLPAEVCAPPPPYCRRVKPLGGGKPDDAALEKLEAELAALGREEPWHEFLGRTGGDLGYLAAGLALGQEACLQAKVAVTRALLAGRGSEARSLLADARQAAADWAEALA